MRISLGLLFTASLLGCTSSPDEDRVGADRVVGPVQTQPDFVDGELRIELEPIHSTSLMPIVPPDDFQDHIRFEGPLGFALGAEYPQALEIDLADPFMQCALPVTYAIDAVSAAPEVQVSAIGERRIRIAPVAEGDFDVVVTGHATYDPSHGCAPDGSDGDSDFEITVRVIARSAAAVTITPPDACAASPVPYLESGARMSTQWFAARVGLVDAAGETFFPANASDDRPISLTVRGRPATKLGLHDEADGLAALVAKGEPGPIDVESALGHAFRFELIEPGRVDSMEVRFDLLGFGGGGIQGLVSGTTYGPFARTSSSLDVAVVGLFVDGDPVCTAPALLSFELTTRSPETCPVFASPGHGDHGGGEQAGVSADVVADGTCALALSAPRFADGGGLGAELSVNIVGAKSLIGPSPDGR
jgi:hypothetical protein